MLAGPLAGPFWNTLNDMNEFKQFLRAVWNHGEETVAGVLVTVSGLVWQLMTWVNPELQAPAFRPWMMWLIGLTLVFVVTSKVWSDEHRAVTLLKARLQPKAMLCHQFEGAPNYLRTARFTANVLERRHIIGAVNLSAVEVARLQVVAEGFEPYIQGVTWVNAALHPLRANPDNGGRFDLSVGDGGPSQFIEVFQELVFLDGQPPALTLVYDQTLLQNLKRFIVGEWFAATFRIQGGIVPRRIRLVAAWNKQTNQFDVQESDEIMPFNNSVGLAHLTAGQVPRIEPLSEPAPSQAPPDDED